LYLSLKYATQCDFESILKIRSVSDHVTQFTQKMNTNKKANFSLLSEKNNKKPSKSEITFHQIIYFVLPISAISNLNFQR
jgi:hypothetical protein